MKQWTRRRLLQTTIAGGVVAGSGHLSPLVGSAAGKAEDARIERLADKIMETKPGRVVDFVLGELRGGLSRQQLLAASFNAGARWRGHHQAYVAHPIRVVSDQIDSNRSLLPLFYYQSSLRYRAPREALIKLDWSKLPSADKAERVFHGAAKEGDRQTASLAMVAMGRSQGPRQAYHHLWMYGAARNHRSAGHNAVSIANTFRTMEATHWRCSEAALRFAAFDASRPTRDSVSPLPAINRKRADQVAKLPPSWSSTGVNRAIVLDLLQRFRAGDPAAACKHVFKLLQQGRCTAGTVWNAVFLTTAELLVRNLWVGFFMLTGHSVTCVNGLHYMFRTVRDPVVRLYAMLEAVEFTTSFLAREEARPALRKRSILDFHAGEAKKDAIDEAFSLLPPKRFSAATRIGLNDVDRAAQLAYSWLKKNRDPRAFLSTALKLMCEKSSEEVHDVKFPMALLENCRYTSPEWQPHLMAASVYIIQGANMEDNKIVKQARDALKL